MSTFSFLQWLFYLNVLTNSATTLKSTNKLKKCVFPYEKTCKTPMCSYISEFGKCQNNFKKCFYTRKKYYKCINMDRCAEACGPGAECVFENDGYSCECKEGTQMNHNISCSSAEECASATCGQQAFCKHAPKGLPRWCYCQMDHNDERATQCEILAESSAKRIETAGQVNTHIKEGTLRHISIQIYRNGETYEHITSSVLGVDADCTIKLNYYPHNANVPDVVGLLKRLKCYNANKPSEIYINQILLLDDYQFKIKTPATKTDYWKCEVHFTTPGAIPIGLIFRGRYSSPQTADVLTTSAPVSENSKSEDMEHTEDNNNLNTATLVAIIMATLGFLVLVVWLVYRIYKRRQKINLAQTSSDINYECLPGHREGPMALPPQWDAQTRTQTHEENLYSVPYGEKSLEQNIYTKPIPRSLRPPPMEPLYTEISLEDGRPTICSESSRSAMPHRSEDVMQTNYMYEGSQEPEQSYVNVASKSQNKMKDKCPVQGKRTYVNELDFQTFDYVEPAYCEVPNFETKK